MPTPHRRTEGRIFLLSATFVLYYLPSEKDLAKDKKNKYFLVYEMDCYNICIYIYIYIYIYTYIYIKRSLPDFTCFSLFNFDSWLIHFAK